MPDFKLIIINGTLIYLLCINIVAIVLTIRDKKLAKKNSWRIPEKHLLLAGVLGGALGEWIVMLLIRHKTQHAKFMISLPVFFTIHIILLGILVIRFFA